MGILFDRTYDGRPIKVLTVIDEFSRESLDIVVERRLGADDVLHCLTDLFVTHGPAEHIKSGRHAVAEIRRATWGKFTFEKRTRVLMSRNGNPLVRFFGGQASPDSHALPELLTPPLPIRKQPA